jgi:hypothetical protein
MRRWQVVRVTALLGLLACGAATPAEASTWWGWLDKLSGPGPFRPEFPLLAVDCPFGNEGNVHLCQPKPDKPFDVKLYITVEFAKWKAPGDPNGAFKKDVNLFATQGIVYLPLANLTKDSNTSRLHVADVGLGLGVFWFSGEGVKDGSGNEGGLRTRLTIPVRLKITPSELLAPELNSRARWRMALSGIYVRTGFDGVPGAFSDNDFFGPAGYRSESSFLGTYGLEIDALRIIRGIRGF